MSATHGANLSIEELNMKTFTAGISATLIAMSAFSGLVWTGPALAQQNFSLSGSACHAITPSQADRLEWRTTGLKNTSLSNGYWVQCPVLKFGNAETFSVRVNFTNESSQEVDVDCNIREYKNGNKVKGSPGSITIAPNSFSSEMIWSGGFKVDTHVNVACLLPAQVSVESVQSLSKGGSGSGYNGTSDVEACLTYATESANPGIRFNNGAVIENVRGDSYYAPGSLVGPTQVVLFNAADGQWYELRDGDVKRVSMLVEPKSCFAPRTATIEAITKDGSYAYYSISGGSDFRRSNGGCDTWEIGDLLTDEETSNWVNLTKAGRCD